MKNTNQNTLLLHLLLARGRDRLETGVSVNTITAPSKGLLLARGRDRLETSVAEESDRRVQYQS